MEENEVLPFAEELKSEKTDVIIKPNEIKRFGNEAIENLYNKFVLKDDRFSGLSLDQPFEYKYNKLRCYLTKFEFVQLITNYYLPFFDFYIKNNINIFPSSFSNYYSKGCKLEINIKKDDNLVKHKVNAFYTLEINGYDILHCGLVESGNCCGSMTIYGLRQEINAIRPMLKVWINMMYDIAIFLHTPILIALNPREYSYTSRLKEHHGFTNIHTFRNRNSTNNVEILVKELPPYFVDETIIIKSL